METIQTETRNADLPDLVDMLKAQSDVRYDVVAPASQIEMRGGDLIVKGGAARVTDDGVTTADARLVSTSIFDEGVSHRFDIPLKYVRTLRGRVATDIEQAPADVAPTLLDENVNYWLAANPTKRHLGRGDQ